MYEWVGNIHFVVSLLLVIIPNAVLCLLTSLLILLLQQKNYNFVFLLRLKRIIIKLTAFMKNFFMLWSFYVKCKCDYHYLLQCNVYCTMGGKTRLECVIKKPQECTRSGTSIYSSA